MADLYVRVDDRLIHGQTIVAWCPLLGIKEIIAVDDVSAQNPMLKTIMTMGVPGTYKTNIVTREEANTLLKVKCTLCQGHYDFFLFRFLFYICLLCRGIKVMPLIDCFHLLL